MVPAGMGPDPLGQQWPQKEKTGRAGSGVPVSEAATHE